MYFVRRILLLIPLLLLISLLAFVLVRLSPGGPFDRERKPATPEIERNLKAKYHLDEPVWKQYGRFLSDLLQGDFGTSLKYRNHTVNDIIRKVCPSRSSSERWRLASRWESACRSASSRRRSAGAGKITPEVSWPC